MLYADLSYRALTATKCVVFHSTKNWGNKCPVAVLPTATAKRAQLLCKVANLTPDQREDLVYAVLVKHGKAASFTCLWDILAALGFADEGK